MKEKKIPKKFTGSRAIYNAMQKALESNAEVCISGLTDGFGKPISHNTFPSTIKRLKEQHFHGTYFYTRRDKELNGVIYLGSKPEPVIE